VAQVTALFYFSKMENMLYCDLQNAKQARYCAILMYKAISENKYTGSVQAQAGSLCCFCGIFIEKKVPKECRTESLAVSEKSQTFSL